jgi:hypothetical protein
MFKRNRIAAFALAFAVTVPSGALVACDREDRQDVEEGVDDAVNKAREGAEDVEREIDENVDTDGQDDN